VQKQSVPEQVGRISGSRRNRDALVCSSKKKKKKRGYTGVQQHKKKGRKNGSLFKDCPAYWVGMLATCICPK
jgi:hypothetical protein